MTTQMVKVRVGDQDHYVAPEVAAALEYARGEAVALRAMRDGAVQPPAAMPVADAAHEALLAARDALRAQQARNDDISTPQGKYREYLRNAHLKAR